MFGKTDDAENQNRQQIDSNLTLQGKRENREFIRVPKGGYPRQPRKSDIVLFTRLEVVFHKDSHGPESLKDPWGVLHGSGKYKFRGFQRTPEVTSETKSRKKKKKCFNYGDTVPVPKD